MHAVALNGICSLTTSEEYQSSLNIIHLEIEHLLQEHLNLIYSYCLSFFNSKQITVNPRHIGAKQKFRFPVKKKKKKLAATGKIDPPQPSHEDSEWF